MEGSWHGKIIEAVCIEHGWDFNAPVKDLPPRPWSTSSTPAAARRS
jgi:hypothetical protein